jgi:preprotein translocase subunit SecA
MFTELMNNIWDEFARYVFNVEIEVQPQEQQRPSGPRWGAGANSSTTGAYSYAGGHSAAGRDAIAAAGGGAVPTGVAEAADMAADEVAELPAPVETRRLDDRERIGRNDPCWCGSGKKFKKCHGASV